MDAILPPEIWGQIATELLLLHKSIGVAWQRYRTVSRVFKQVIEDFYLAQVVRGARIYVDCQPWGSFNFAPTVSEYYGEYWFDEFDDEDKRLAVLRLNEDRCTFSRTDHDSEISSSSRHKWLDGFEQTIEDIREPGYNYCLIMSLGIRDSVGQGFSDMLPIDLKYPSEAGPRKFVFDWRTHLCIVFRHMSEIKLHEFIHDIHHVPELASRLHAATEAAGRPHHHQDDSYRDIMKRLMDHANTSQVGPDGRLLLARESRRILFGRRVGHFARLGGGNPQRESLHEWRFATHDSWHVAEKLLHYQEAAAMEGKLWKL